MINSDAKYFSKSLPFFEDTSLKIKFRFKIGANIHPAISERFNAVKKFRTIMENKCENVI